MAKYILRKIPDEHAYFDFDLEYGDYINDGEDIVIVGNDRMRSFGDKTLIDVINHDYCDDDCDYDYDVFKELKKLTGKVWDRTTAKGYCQSDWQDIYYSADVSVEEVKNIGDYYMGLFDEYVLEDDDGTNCSYYVPHDVCWKGKGAICEYVGVPAEETTVLVDDGYKKVYKYKELED